jgi:hypothetical protein
LKFMALMVIQNANYIDAALKVGEWGGGAP